MKKKKKKRKVRNSETPKVFLSFWWCNDACSHIKAAVCLLRLYSYACVYSEIKNTELKYRGD